MNLICIHDSSNDLNCIGLICFINFKERHPCCVINTLKYADDLVLLAKEEKVLQDMIDKLIEIGGGCGVEMNVEKTKVMRVSRQPFPVKNYDRPKTTRECGIF